MSDAQLDAEETSGAMNNTNASIAGADMASIRIASAQNATNKTIVAINAEFAEVLAVNSVEAQVDDNLRLLGTLGPRIGKLALRLRGMEAKLQGGNVSEVVEDIAKQSLTDVFRDIGRTLVPSLDQ